MRYSWICLLFPDDMSGDSMHNMPGVVGNAVGSVTNSTTGSFNNIPRSTNPKLTPMQIRCKFGQLGPSKGQFNSPHGFCLGTDEDIIVADTNNHRIQVKIVTVHCLFFCSPSGFSLHIYSTDIHYDLCLRYSRKLAFSSFNSEFPARKRANCGTREK